MGDPILPLITLIEYLVRYETGSKLAGVIYIHRICDRRFTGISVHNFKMFREICGDSTLKNVILVTNMWEEVTQAVGEAREQELITDFFKPALDEGAQLARYHNTAESAHDIIRRIMKNQPVALQVQCELVDKGKDIADTVAGKAVNNELNVQIRRHQMELKAIQEEMVQALKDKDEELGKELEEKNYKLREQMNKIRQDSQGMASNHHGERKRIEEPTFAIGPIHRHSQVSMENEKSQAHSTYYMDDRMIILSVGALRRTPRNVDELLPSVAGYSLEPLIGTWKSTVRFCCTWWISTAASMELEGPQTRPQSLSVITFLRRSLRFSWTFSITGLFRLPLATVPFS